MTDLEIMELREKNSDRFLSEKEVLFQEYFKMDEYLMHLLKQNATHRHFKTKKEMVEFMAKDYNPYNTFSFGRKDPTKCKAVLHEV
jgi:hypothetical protein